jgi:hypothetical protein
MTLLINTMNKTCGQDKNQEFGHVVRAPEKRGIKEESTYKKRI